MGRDCGYLALLSGLATGAERVYLPEDGITLDDLTADLAAFGEGFRSGKRLGLVVRSEGADPVYTTGFITSLFQKEGRRSLRRSTSDLRPPPGRRRSIAIRPDTCYQSHRPLH